MATKIARFKMTVEYDVIYDDQTTDVKELSKAQWGAMDDFPFTTNQDMIVKLHATHGDRKDL